jgi:hypothetical protein
MIDEELEPRRPKGRYDMSLKTREVKMKSWIDGVALVSSIISILSILLNVIQWQERATLRETLKARLQGACSSFHHIAVWAVEISGILEGGDLAGSGAAKILTRAGRISGAAESARGEIVMQAHELLSFLPQHVNLVEHDGEEAGAAKSGA